MIKLTEIQFEASAYIFEKANGNIKSEYELDIIKKSGLSNTKGIKSIIIKGLNEKKYQKLNTRINAYWALSKINDKQLIPHYKNWLKEELKNKEPGAVYQILIALGNMDEPVFNINRNGSTDFSETELNMKDAKDYLQSI
jgi:hypothetical protein